MGHIIGCYLLVLIGYTSYLLKEFIHSSKKNINNIIILTIVPSLQEMSSLLPYISLLCSLSLSLSLSLSHWFFHELTNSLSTQWINCSPTFIKIHKATAVESFKPDPYVTAVILSCAMWCFCGMPFVHPDNLLVITINGFGFIFEIIYITIFFFYSPWSKRVSKNK